MNNNVTISCIDYYLRIKEASEGRRRPIVSSWFRALRTTSRDCITDSLGGGGSGAASANVSRRSTRRGGGLYGDDEGTSSSSLLLVVAMSVLSRRSRVVPRNEMASRGVLILFDATDLVVMVDDVDDVDDEDEVNIVIGDESTASAGGASSGAALRR